VRGVLRTGREQPNLPTGDPRRSQSAASGQMWANVGESTMDNLDHCISSLLGGNIFDPFKTALPPETVTGKLETGKSQEARDKC